MRRERSVNNSRRVPAISGVVRASTCRQYYSLSLSFSSSSLSLPRSLLAQWTTHIFPSNRPLKFNYRERIRSSRCDVGNTHEWRTKRNVEKFNRRVWRMAFLGKRQESSSSSRCGARHGEMLVKSDASCVARSSHENGRYKKEDAITVCSENTSITPFS